MSYTPPSGSTDYRLTGSAFFIDPAPRFVFQNEKNEHDFLLNGTVYVANPDFAFQPPASWDFAFSGDAYIPETDFSDAAQSPSDPDQPNIPYVSERDRLKAYAIPSGQVNFLFPQAVYIIKSDFDGKRAVNFVPPPEILVTHRSQWQQGEVLQASIESRLNDGRIVQTTRSQSSHQAKPLEPAVFGVFWDQVTKKQNGYGLSHGTGKLRANQTETSWRQAKAKDKGSVSAWDKSIREQDAQTGDVWNKARVVDQQTTSQHQTVDVYGASRKAEDRTGYLHPQQPLNFTFRQQLVTPDNLPLAWFRFGTYDPTNPPIQPRDSHVTAGFDSKAGMRHVVRLPWGLGRKAKESTIDTGYGQELPKPPPEPKPEPDQPDIRESYLLMNVITAVVLPDRTPIELPNMEIGLDIDSFSWSFSAELWGATSLALVEPDQDGPKQVEIDINGWKWIFIIERYSTNRTFGKEQYTVHGTSRTQLLAAPYAPQRSKSSSSDLNAKQAITEELQNTGFSASYPNLNEYSTPDWIIPGNTFSYQNQTAMQVIATLASTAGSVIIPSRNTDVLSIQPRYPSSPWSWSSATMDKIIPAALVISLSASWRPEQEYNAVYVSGLHEGVAVNVKRTGTAGDNPAQDILEDWLTETQVNTERGRNELSKGGHQSVTTLELPLTDTSTAPGLIEPGMLVEVQDTFMGKSGNWRALCLSTNIAAGAGKVVQIIELERHY